MQVDIGADDPLVDQDYYLSRMDLSLGDLELGQVNMLIPAALLELDGLRSKSAADSENSTPPSEQVIVEREKTGKVGGQTIQQEDLHSLDILVVGDDENEAAKIVKVLEDARYSVRRLTFKDNLHNYIPGNLKAIYLVMRDVNEQAFGVAIKVSSACSVPLIAAGPDWTRTKVIKAVKYGVRDIILTPASEGDLQENLQNNLLKLAA
jgi:PleD family two-component response regulator